LFLLHQCTPGAPPAPPVFPDHGCNGDCKHGDASGEDHHTWFPGRRLLHLNASFGCGCGGCR
jgi:hypothetical protein